MTTLIDPAEAEKRLEARGVRVLDMGFMTTQKPPPRDYLFRAWAFTARTYGLLYAPGDTGKSYLMLTILLTLALSGADCEAYDPLCLRPLSQKGGWQVTYVTGEDNDDAVWYRVHALTRGMGRDAYLTAQRNMRVLSTQGLPNRQLITDASFRIELASVCAGKRLVGFDTLSRFHAAKENDNSEMAVVIAGIEAFTRDTGAASLVAHHCNKASQGADGVGISGLAIRGASCIRESARWALGMKKVDEDVSALVEDKHNDGRGHDPIHVAWTSVAAEQEDVGDRVEHARTLERCDAPSTASVTSIAASRRGRSGGGNAGIY